MKKIILAFCLKMLKVKKSDYYNDLDNKGDNPWLNNKNKFNEEANIDGEIQHITNSGYENLLRPLVHYPPYLEIDFDLKRVDPYEKKNLMNLFWDETKEYYVGIFSRARDNVVVALKEIIKC